MKRIEAVRRLTASCGRETALVVSALCLLLLVVPSPVAHAQEESINVDECAYLAFTHYDITSKCIEEPSPYDEDDFKSRVAQLLMQGYGEDRHSVFWYSDVNFNNLESLHLYRSFRFEADSDFVLLDYRRENKKDTDTTDIVLVWSGPLMGPFYLGVIPSSGKLYLLSEGFGDRIEVNFNRMLQENEGRPAHSYFCKAALLVHLKYKLHETAIVETWEDIALWFSSLLHPTYFPAEWYDGTGLFTLFPTSRSDLPENDLESLTTAGEDFLGSVKDLVSVRSPFVWQDKNTVSVVFTAFNEQVGEVATWEAVFSRSGQMISLWYTEAPPKTKMSSPGTSPYEIQYMRDSTDN